jgi:cytidyltransferase-like protein
MMTKTIDELLRRASADIHAGKLHEAAEILNALKDEHPLSPSVARLWCLLARRTGQTAAVPDYAAKIYAHVEGDLDKARWAHIMGTANFISLNLEAAHANFTCALGHLIALIRTGKVPKNKKQKKIPSDIENAFSTGKAEQLLWETCANLALHEIQAFPFAGTLLGIVRNGALLEFDKDLDIAVWAESLDACCAELEKNGWVKVQMGIDYSNYRDYVHEETGITLDVCGLKRKNAQQIVGGFSLPDRPEEYQRVSIFPAFELIQSETSFGPIWFPQQPEIILNAFYGDWRTPNPHWDTVVSALNLEKFTLLVRCYAYYRLTNRWLSGDLAKAWSYALQIGLQDPDDALALRCRQWLENTMLHLQQEIPVWPQNKPQRRIYTRMVADLFHQGHVNFLRLARALGTHLTVCVVSDKRVLDNKGKLPVMTQDERVTVVAACKYVDAVITESPVNATVEFMQQHGFDIYTFACASEGEREEKYKQCANLPSSMVHEIDYTPGISTSDLVARTLCGAGKKASKIDSQRLNK